MSAIVAMVLVAAAPAAAQTSSGGTRALPLAQGEGGGGLAPAWPDDVTARAPAEAAADGTLDPAAGPAQNGQAPTTPEGEPQPNGPDEPVDDEDGTGDETNGELPDPNAETPEEGGAAPESAGGLPSTGLELAALAAIGLGLLMGGAALRPRLR